jgi:TPP-dependent trihydroxycyclohexane-1,2-dione (THcHDO) dehydratase
MTLRLTASQAMNRYLEKQELGVRDPSKHQSSGLKALKDMTKTAGSA